MWFQRRCSNLPAGARTASIHFVMARNHKCRCDSSLNKPKTKVEYKPSHWQRSSNRISSLYWNIAEQHINADHHHQSKRATINFKYPVRLLCILSRPGLKMTCLTFKRSISIYIDIDYVYNVVFNKIISEKKLWLGLRRENNDATSTYTVHEYRRWLLSQSLFSQWILFTHTFYRDLGYQHCPSLISFGNRNLRHISILALVNILFFAINE